jgi:hypothetical protein
MRANMELRLKQIRPSLLPKTPLKWFPNLLVVYSDQTFKIEMQANTKRI